MLDEVELFVAGRDPEIRAVIRDLVGLVLSIFANDCETALLPKWRIRKNHVHGLASRGGFKAVINLDHRTSGISANSMKKKIHGTQTRDIGDKINSVQCLSV